MHKVVEKLPISIRDYYPLLILLLIFFLSLVFVPNFSSPVNLSNLVRQSAVIGIVSLGMLAVIISGGIDLSVGSVAALSGVLCVGLQTDVPLALAITAGILAGALVGAFNGALIAFMRISPFIMTLGMLALARGLTFAYTEGAPLAPLQATRDVFLLPGRGEVLGLPAIGVVWLGFILAVAFLLQKTVIGRRVFAVGSSSRAAFASGVPISATLLTVYTFSGLLSGVAGVLLSSRIGVATPTMGTSFELEAIAAVVIGGASLSGGKGTVLGTVIGTVILVLIVNILNLLDVSVFWQDAVRGAIIIAAMVFGNFRRAIVH